MTRTDLNDRLMAVHLANASDTSPRQYASSKEAPRRLSPRLRLLVALLSAAFGWALVGGVAYLIYLLSAIFDL
jgi:hypothetical protein